MSETEEQRHAAKMAKKKAARDRMMAAKDESGKGLLIVHTGAGKGKSTAAFGMAIRCLGHGFKVGVVQFIKGAWDPAERKVLEGFGDRIDFRAMGEGFTWETQDKARDIAAAEAAWKKAKELIRDPRNTMVLLDEINIALRYDYIPLADVLEFLATEKPPMTHVVLTGRNAAEGLIELADLVTEMTLVKHP